MVYEVIDWPDLIHNLAMLVSSVCIGYLVFRR